MTDTELAGDVADDAGAEGVDATPDVPAQLQVRDPEAVLEEGAEWLRSYLEETGQERLVVCVSGGLDSAVTALWAARAVGPERLILLGLPYGLEVDGTAWPADDPTSMEHAARVAEELGGDVDFRVLDIAPVVDREARDSGLLEVDEGSGDAGSGAGTGPDPVTRWRGNLKARVRAVRGRTVANYAGGLLLGTENRSEYLLGYFTVDGDEQSDLGLLRSFFKTEVRQLAAGLPVPGPIREKPPSAGLWPGQADSRELGFDYHAADRVLHHFFGHAGDELLPSIEQGEEELDAVEVPGVEPAVVRKVLDRVRATGFKRRSTPHYRPSRRGAAVDPPRSRRSGPGRRTGGGGNSGEGDRKLRR